MYSYLADDNSEHKKTKGVKKMFVVTISHNEYKNVFLNKTCLRHSMNRIKQELIKSTRFLYLTLIIKYTSKAMGSRNQLLVIKVTYKKKLYLIGFLKKLFCQENCFNFQSNQDDFFTKHIKFENCKTLKKELMTIAWHPKRQWDWCVSEDEKKEIDPVFIEEL